MLKCASVKEISIPGLTKGDEKANSLKQSEDVLHALINRFNQCLSECKHIKAEIELLRKERHTVELIISNVEKELRLKESDVSQLIDQSNAMLSTRDYTLNRLNQLRKLADREHQDFNVQLTELTKILTDDQREYQKKFNEISLAKSKIDLAKVALEQQSNMLASADYGNGSDSKRKQELTSLFEEIRKATGVCSLREMMQYFEYKDQIIVSLFNKYNVNETAINQFVVGSKFTNDKIGVIRESLFAGSSSSSGAESGATRVGPKISVETRTQETVNTNIALEKQISNVIDIVKSMSSRLLKESKESFYHVKPEIVVASFGPSGTPIGSVNQWNVVQYLSALEFMVQSL